MLLRRPQAMVERFHTQFGVVLLLCAVVFLYGTLVTVKWRLDIRSQGSHAIGKVLSYQGLHPVVEFQTQIRERIRVPVADAFTPWTAPRVGDKVQVFYLPADPERAHAVGLLGVSQYEWLFLPAVLTFLFLAMLRMGLGLLLFFDKEARS